jgi:prophage antirepressor-like protein
MQLAIFKYEENNLFGEIRTLELNGDIWFVAQDVCNVLEIQNSRQAIDPLDDDEKLTYPLHTSGQKRDVNFVSESGLYFLIFNSKKDAAKRFRKWITSEVIPSIRKTGSFGVGTYEGSLPKFVKRYNDNWDRIESGYFSVISELYIRLFSQFEKIGYIIPDVFFDGKDKKPTELRPDVSVGLTFAKWLEKNYPEHEYSFKTYKHWFRNGIEVDARQYPNEILPLFIKFIDEVWLYKYAQKYFETRDRKALDYLPKLLVASKNKAKDKQISQKSIFGGAVKIKKR